jgi:uncharacterized protein YqjF (DUF2071 family)
MTWHDLLFAHWRVEPARLASRIPPGLSVDTFDGSAWLGIVPFTMSAVRPRLLPPIPTVSAFPELNVRTYVMSERDGRAGVWFFSLDATSRLAVRGARAAFGLAYMNARMSCRCAGGWIEYDSVRAGPWNSLAYGTTATPAAEFRASYRPAGDAAVPGPGSLEDFLTSRYCLYAWRRGRLIRGEIDHAPWRLHAAQWRPRVNTMTLPVGVPVSGEPLLHYAERMDVVAWAPTRV